MHAPAVILVRPQLGGNIGAVARAMSNFGLSELRLVAPTNGWPNPHAYEMATVSATPILDNARVFPTLAEALADIHIAHATTARPRFMEKAVMPPEESARSLRAEMQTGLRTALVFGPERTGLENEDIVRCDAIITLSTAAENSSLNLGQCAVIVAYAWHLSGQTRGFTRPDQAQAPAPKEDSEAFFTQLEGYLDAVNYFRTPEKKPLMWQNIRTIFQRARMNEQELRTLRGVARDLFQRRLE